jgi:hypothetical protein
MSYTPFADLEGRLETALAAVYATLVTPAPPAGKRKGKPLRADLTPAILTGWGAETELNGPAITIVCRDSDAERAGLGLTGNHTIIASIAARTHAKDDTGTTHTELEAYMRSILFTQNLPAIVNEEATDLTVMTSAPTHFSRATLGNWRVSTQLVEFYVAGSAPA